MSLRLIEVYVEEGHTDTLTAIAEQQGAIDCYTGAISEDGRQTVRLLVSPSKQQAILDQIQTALSGSDGWRVVLLPVEAALPAPAEDRDKGLLPGSSTATREELLADIRSGTRLDRAYLCWGPCRPLWRQLACSATMLPSLSAPWSLRLCWVRTLPSLLQPPLGIRDSWDWPSVPWLLGCLYLS